MALGTGIFLAALVLALVQLFLGTRDRWPWKRITAVLAVLTIALPLTGWGVYAVNDWWSKRPVKATSFLGKQIGAKRDDVIFLIGKPNNSNDPKTWIYELTDTRPYIMVGFDRDTVSYVGSVVSRNAGLNGIMIGDTYQSVLERLGDPSVVFQSADKTRRYLNYLTFGMTIGVAFGTVQFLTAYDGKAPMLLKDEQAIK